jgi:hypothetical protein
VQAIKVMDNEDPQPFVQSVQQMEAFCRAEAARDGGESIFAEVAARGIPQMSLYDTAFEFVVFDCLDDLKSPPQARVERGVEWPLCGSLALCSASLKPFSSQCSMMSHNFHQPLNLPWLPLAPLDPS